MKASQWISNKHAFAPGFAHVQTLCKIYAGERLNIWINLKLSFSRIMSPVSPRKREVSPSRHSLSPPAELAAH